MQPNLAIPLFIVAPGQRRDDVRREITRPTFARALRRPLARSCRYIAFETLRERANAVLDMRLARALRNSPDEFLDTIAETFDLP